MTNTLRQTELTAISRNTPDTTVTAIPTVTDGEHEGWGRLLSRNGVYKLKKLNKGMQVCKGNNIHIHSSEVN